MPGIAVDPVPDPSLEMPATANRNVIPPVSEFGRVLFKDPPVADNLPAAREPPAADLHPRALATRRATIIGVVVGERTDSGEIQTLPNHTLASGQSRKPGRRSVHGMNPAVTAVRSGEKHGYSKKGRASLELGDGRKGKYNYHLRSAASLSQQQGRVQRETRMGPSTADDFADSPVSAISSEGNGAAGPGQNGAGQGTPSARLARVARPPSISATDAADSSVAGKPIRDASTLSVTSAAGSSRVKDGEGDWADDFVRVPPKRKEWWAYLVRQRSQPVIGSSKGSHPASQGRYSMSSRFGEWRGSSTSKRSTVQRLRRSIGKGQRSSRGTGGPNASGGGGRVSSFSYDASESLQDEGSLTFGTRVDVTATRYGKRWAMDLFALYHNVVRYQLGHLIAILRRISVAPCGPAQFLPDLFVWLDTFQRLVNAVLAAHERAIFPWIETVAELERRVSKVAREEAQTQMEEASIAVSRCREVLEQEGDDQFAFATLVECLTLLGAQLVNYFGLIERECPPALEMFFTEEGKNEVEVTIRDVIAKNKGQAEVFFPMVSVWLEAHSHVLHQRWMNRVMRGGRRRIQLLLWTKALKSGYLRIGDSLIGKGRVVR